MSQSNSNYYLELRPNPPGSSPTIHLPLFNDQSAADDWLEANAIQSVYDDQGYDIYIGLSDCKELTYLESIDTTVSGDVTHQTDLSKRNRSITSIKLFSSYTLFSHVLGLTFFSVTLHYERDEKTFYTMPISVCHPEGPETENLQRMSDYVIDNGKWLFENFGAMNDLSPRHGKESQLSRFFNERLDLIERIIKVYSYNMHFFSTNSRAKLVKKGEIENFEKLSSLSYPTIEFIAQHPEELLPTHSDSGISYGSKHYLPKRTLIIRNDFDRNIYENQVILAFLTNLSNSINESIANIRALSEKIPSIADSNDGWVNSSQIIVRQATEILKGIEERSLKNLKEIQRLKIQFRQFLPVDEIVLSRIPKPTALFRSMLQYRQIYDVINAWFLTLKTPMPENYFIVDFSRSSNVYEYYCLLQIFQSLESEGWVMVDKKHLPWNNPYMHLKDDTSEGDTYNLFEFTKDNANITVYFEPMISRDAEHNYDIGLVRNSTGKLVRVGEDPKLRKDRSRPLFYTPDFVLRKTENNESSFLIMDAKYSRKSVVIEEELLDLIFKYMLCISPTTQNSRLYGLIAICGKLKREDDTTDRTPLWDIQEGFTPCFSRNRVQVLELNEEAEKFELRQAIADFAA